MLCETEWHLYLEIERGLGGVVGMRSLGTGRSTRAAQGLGPE